MMSMFSTSPHISGAAVSPFTGADPLVASKHSERSPDQQVELFQTNPNSIPVFSKGGCNTPFWGVSAQSETDGVNSDKLSLASHHIEDCLNHYNLTPTHDDRVNGRVRADLSHDFKTLSNEEQQQIVDKKGEDADVLARTIHLRFLPTLMKQGELADLCRGCGEYHRVRICGNATSNQNWIYGFVEFATRDGASRMMKMSGIELSNGPDRRPLRLKCSSAKQRIVDSVFHDANPETGTLCTFGLGSFASRSLKDTLESYFNLKTKEAQQQQKSKQSTLETWRINSSTSTSLSPNAPSFSPSFGTAVHPFAVNASTRLGDSNKLFIAPVFSGINQPSVTRSDCSDSTAGANPGFCIPPPPSPIIFSEFPSVTGATVSNYNPLQNTLNFLFLTTPDHQNFSSPSWPVGMAVTSAEGLPTTASASSEASSGQGIATMATLEVAHGGLHGAAPARTVGITSDLLCTPSSISSSAPDPAVQLALELHSMVERGLVTDGGEVIERGCALALEGLRHAHTYATTSHGFDGVVGKLGALLELLDKHRVLTGGAAEVAAGDASSGLPQGVTQLRLFVNLLLALLHLLRRSLTSALPFIKATVNICNQVPLVPVRRPSLIDAWRLGSLGDPLTAARPCRVTSLLDEAMIGCSAVGQSDGLSDGEFTRFFPREGADKGLNCANMFNIIADTPESVVSAIVSFSEEEVEEGYEARRAGALKSKDQGELLGYSPSSLCDGISTIDTQTDAQVLYYRDVAFHGYVLSVLVAIGLALEEVNSLITHNVFEMAAQYAGKVLGMRCAVLDAFLRDSGEPPYTTAGMRLSASVFPELGECHDITAFPRFFFNALNSDLLTALKDPRQFWMRLPPLHCLRCIPC